MGGFFERLSGRLRGRLAVLSAIWAHPANRGSKTRAIADYLLWSAARFSMDARHVLSMPGGLELIVGPKENYASAVYVHGLSDFCEMLLLAHLLRKQDLFVDVGANVGMYSVWVSGITGARSISFEPVPSTFATLRQNIAINALGDLIRARQVAVSDAAGEVFMTTSEGGLDHVVDYSPGGGQTSVPAARLDELIAGEAPVALKIDVEGFERRVLDGAGNILAMPSLVIIVIELQDWTLGHYGTSEREIRSVLEQAGFRASTYDPFDRVLKDRPGDDKKGLNEVFVRRGSQILGRLREAPKIVMRGFPSGV